MSGKRVKRAQKNRKQEQVSPSYIGRRRAVLGLFALAVCALVWRAADQQIFEKDFLQSEGADRHLDKVELPAHRGVITDRNGAVLAVSTPVDSVGANPRLLRPDSQTLAALAKALGMGQQELRQRLARYSQRRFVYLKRRLAPQQAEQVMAVVKQHDIKGVRLEREYKRFYTGGEVFSHMIGFTNVDDQGQEGMELAFDKALRGENGAKRVLRDGRRQVVEDVESVRMPRPGKNLALSLEQRLQFITYRELKAAVQRHKAKAGSAVLLDSRTGEVLALVNQPSYNPNRSRSNKGGRLRNRSLTDVFEPGSTMKPFTVAAALESGRYTATSRIDTAPGFFKLGQARIKDHRNLGTIDMETLLRRSSNVGASKLALDLPKEDFWRILSKLGFGVDAGTGFPGEAGGQLTHPANWARIDQATLAFGYGISVSTLQLAQAYAVLAADGLKKPVSLLRQESVPAGERVLSPRTAQAVRSMLEGVVSMEGTAPLAAVPGYRVAGKTGTVKKVGRDGYSEDRYLSLFAGMAPASNPRLVMVVVLDEPAAGKYYGGQVAAPVFSRVMSEALRLLNVAPDDLPGGEVRLAAMGEKS